MLFITPKATAQVLFSEVMYHPVETPVFDTNGLPVLDLSADVHEFVELQNIGVNPVSLGGWRITGGISFDFPVGTAIPAGGFLVLAKNPGRLTAIAQYALIHP